LKLIERPPVALAPKIAELPSTNEFLRFHFTYASDTAQRVPGLLIKQAATGRRPVVISLHGTGGAKESQLALLTNAAARDFIGVAIDGRYHGERSTQGKGAAAYHDAILRAHQTGQEHPFLYDTVWDVIRLIDYLETREDVDFRRIGVIGFSKGGMETYLAAAVEPRITVAVPCIGVQSFRWALDHDAWKSRVETIQPAVNAAAKEAGRDLPDTAIVRRFYDRVVPGIYGQFDGPAMLPFIAPRPLLVINGEIDPRTPLPGVEECAAAARKPYAAHDAAERFVLRIQEQTGHKVNPDSLDAALGWFERWLKP
jgi:dienelactone hydrolase